jgi:hypothetical protein
MLFFMPVAVGGLALVLNWLYLVLAHGNMQERSDVLAIAGVSQLLDENILRDLPPNQADDILAAEATVLDYLNRNNAVGPVAFQVNPADVTVAPGFVADVTQPVAGANFDPAPIGNPYNSLRINIERSGSTANPVAMFIRGMGSPDSADITAYGCATLDNRLVGFRPSSTTASPVVPLAIEASAWNVERVVGNMDGNGNGRKELNVRLAHSSGSGPAANSVLIGFNGAVGIVSVWNQIFYGITPSDVPGGQLGPATSTTPLTLSAQQSTLNWGQTTSTAHAFNALVATNSERRVFPLYENGSFDGSTVKLIGFAGARVIGATNLDASPDHQLQVTIEPEFIVHVTAWTEPGAPERNPYIHKIRVSR